MQFDLDKVLEAANPWDFTVVVGGTPHPTRRATVGELAVFQAAGEHPERLAGMIGCLFEGVPPGVGDWSLDQVLAFSGGYLAYFNRVAALGKDPAGIVTAAEAAVAAAMSAAEGGPGDSPPRS